MSRSSLSQLRAELGELIYRWQTGKLRANREAPMAIACLKLANDLVGAALVKELEAAKAKESSRV